MNGLLSLFAYLTWAHFSHLCEEMLPHSSRSTDCNFPSSWFQQFVLRQVDVPLLSQVDRLQLSLLLIWAACLVAGRCTPTFTGRWNPIIPPPNLSSLSGSKQMLPYFHRSIDSRDGSQVSLHHLTGNMQDYVSLLHFSQAGSSPVKR